jgi:hypothetical protein
MDRPFVASTFSVSRGNDDDDDDDDVDAAADDDDDEEDDDNVDGDDVDCFSDLSPTTTNLGRG